MKTSKEILPKLSMEQVTLRYANKKGKESETKAVDLIGEMGISAPSISISPAEFTVLLGPSGCGKSSLLRMLAGLVLPTSGTIKKDGAQIKGPKRDRGMVFQRYTAFPWLTVEENIHFGLGLCSRSKRQNSKSEVEQVLEVVGLADSA